MRQQQIITLLFILIISTQSLYDSKSKVIKLDSKNFKTQVIQSKELWLVEFYAPWCGHCKSLAPEWEKAAKALEGIAKIGAVDMTTDQDVGSPYNIQGFPTIKFFGDNKNSPLDYNGGRTANEIVKYLHSESKKITDIRLFGKSQSNNNNNSNSNNNSNNKGAEKDGDVVVLTDDNFNELVMKSQEPWFVEFYAPWCGHCKNLAPEWNKLATNLKSQKINVAKVDATVHSKVAQRFGVNGYPTLKFFPTGNKTDKNVIPYNGNRDANSMENWAKEQSDKFKPVVINQLIDQSVYDEFCTNSSGICILFFLPHIYDAGAAQRNKQLQLIKIVAEQNKHNPVSFLWSQGGDQYDLEEKLNAGGSGYPSLVAISYKKNVYTVFKGSFNEKNIQTFLKSLVQGKITGFSTLSQTPPIVKVAKWDGKDAKPQEDKQQDL
ncbi:protein disulfide isomerase family protein, putative [Ichthyophthirius multifiliis]|uniref:protein disulfide-isomerase n=1 Tax=Ichthyophthirius multifiliis TaxID=5932 RepID=G0QMR6_ICHMU|nr:protein disulfide isomerase family protein, putative [Ichthyophthirius multifiliis]EGR33469.1 protein disulfide isomerase family protein, putative [Ichthyophthirius multifiliis]|eukprot:XP_004037455.1 protein disulfide isomerase family protein, putative [Ichthyophthirius multifiliis]